MVFYSICSFLANSVQGHCSKKHYSLYDSCDFSPAAATVLLTLTLLKNAEKDVYLLSAFSPESDLYLSCVSLTEVHDRLLSETNQALDFNHA